MESRKKIIIKNNKILGSFVKYLGHLALLINSTHKILDNWTIVITSFKGGLRREGFDKSDVEGVCEFYKSDVEGVCLKEV